MQHSKIKQPYAPLPKPPSPVASEWRCVNILGRVWRIEFVDGTIYHDERAVEGLTNFRAQLISLSGNNGVCREQQRQTLIHEIQHAINYMGTGGFNEEQTTCASELGWYSFLRHQDNDWAVKFILEKEIPYEN